MLVLGLCAGLLGLNDADRLKVILAGTLGKKNPAMLEVNEPHLGQGHRLGQTAGAGEFVRSAAMPLGIRPINDFAFKKTFGTPENRPCLISLLSAVLEPSEPIVEVTLENPFNLQDFKDDKLSVLDIKAVDRTGAIYDVEIQLTTYEGLV